MPFGTFKKCDTSDFRPRPPQASKFGCYFVMGFFILIAIIVIFGDKIFL